MPLPPEEPFVDVKVSRSTGTPLGFFAAWSAYGTRYRLFLMPLLAFDEAVRHEIGASPPAVLVTLWGGHTPGRSAIFNAGGRPLVDAYVGEKLGLQGEDLLSVARQLRALLLRQG